MKNKNYYEILGVEKDATLTEISESKDKLKFGDESTRVPFSEWKNIDEAYETLSNPDKRAEYDATLNSTLPNNDSVKVNNFNIEKNNKGFYIKEIVIQELEEIRYYNYALKDRINSLIANPTNQYKLKVNINKYQNQIELLNKMLEMKYYTYIKTKFERFRIKLEMKTIREEIEDSIVWLRSIKTRISE